MDAKDDISRRLRLDYALETRPDLARQLLDDPAGVLRELGADESDLACTDDAHAALARAEPAADELTRLGGETSLTESLGRLAGVLGPSLGEDFVVDKVPFGMRFAERLRTRPGTGLDITGTGTVECTVALKCSPDVDG
jgi:hypothetical protein